MKQANLQTTPKITLPIITFSNGALEGLKYVGVVAMVLDHTNKYLFNGTIPIMFNIGRIALPLFILVIAFNFARSEQIKNGAYKRTMSRLAVFSVVASMPYIALGNVLFGWWPLNILFTLLTLVGLFYTLETKKYFLATFVFVVGGAVVEFWWPALIFGVGLWQYFRKPSFSAILLILVGSITLCFINQNGWLFMAIPLVLLASNYNLNIPRFRWFFYSIYPLHLIALWLVRIPMAEAGYMFFTGQ